MYTFSNILHSILIVLPLIFALQLLTYKTKNGLSNKILGILLIVVSIYYFINAGFISEQLGITKTNSNFLFFLFLCVNPFYYLYTKSLTTENFKFSTQSLVHFIPAIVMLFFNILIVNYYADKTNQNKILNPYNLKVVAVIFYNLQVLGYTIFMFYLIHKHNINLKNYFSFKNEKNNLNWLKIFIVIYILFSSLDLMVFYIQSFKQWELFYYILTLLFFTFLGYFGVKQTDIYAGARTLINSLPETEKQIPGAEKKVTEKKQLLSEDRSKKIMMDLVDLMITEKPYKNPELSIFNIAKSLNINKTYISYVINENLHENFTNFINRYRIDEAKELLEKSEFDNYTLEGIANLAGFNSKSSFNSAFKKFTGITPSSYKKNIRT